MVVVVPVALPQKQKNKNPTWWWQRMVIRMLPCAKNENSQPSHGSGGISAATSLRMPPAPGNRLPPASGN